MRESTQIKLEPDAARASIQAIDSVHDDLKQAAQTLRNALEVAQAGDPHGYLTSGLEAGFRAARMSDSVCAQLQQLIRDATATITLLAEHDQTLVEQIQETFHNSSKSIALSIGHAILNSVQKQSEPYVINDVGATELAVFFSQYEDDINIPGHVLEKYLTNPEIMAIQNACIQDLVDHLKAGGAPLNPDQFFQLVRTHTQDTGSALLISHNILKALSRGRSPIDWHKKSKIGEPAVYTFNGQEIYLDDLPLHPQAQPNYLEQPSIFYRFFDASSFGTDDAGDWYHYYLTATLAYYGTSGAITYNDYGGWPSYPSIVGREVANVMLQIRDPHIPSSDAYDGWLLANSLSFLEAAVYGADNAQTLEDAIESTQRESRFHMQGALYGLSLAGVKPEDSWRWWIANPASVSLSIGEGVFGQVQIDDVDPITLEIITPDGEESVSSGSTDDEPTNTTPRRGEDTRRDR